MGVEDDMNRCIKIVESETDEGMRLTRRLDELAYVRTPQIFAHLRKKYLDSERELPSVRGWGKGVSYAQHAAALLAKVLPDFPVKKHVGGFSEQDIQICRKWMAMWEQRRTAPPKVPEKSDPPSRISAEGNAKAPARPESNSSAQQPHPQSDTDAEPVRVEGMPKSAARPEVKTSTKQPHPKSDTDVDISRIEGLPEIAARPKEMAGIKQARPVPGRSMWALVAGVVCFLLAGAVLFSGAFLFYIGWKKRARTAG